MTQEIDLKNKKRNYAIVRNISLTIGSGLVGLGIGHTFHQNQEITPKEQTMVPYNLPSTVTSVYCPPRSLESLTKSERSSYLAIDQIRREQQWAPENELAERLYQISLRTDEKTQNVLNEFVFLLSPEYARSQGIDFSPLPGLSLEQGVIEQLDPIGNKLKALAYKIRTEGPFSLEELSRIREEESRLYKQFEEEHGNN